MFSEETNKIEHLKTISVVYFINSPTPAEEYIRQYIWSSLFRGMACRLFGT